MMTDLVLGLDGGGTRTRARLANVRAELLGRGAAGASNPQANGDDAAERAMLQAIQAAFDDAHLARRMVAAACFGVGGIERAAERTRFEKWARTNVAPRVKFLNDGEILLAAGTPEEWGIALIAGTGMIGWG